MEPSQREPSGAPARRGFWRRLADALSWVVRDRPPSRASSPYVVHGTDGRDKVVGGGHPG